MNFAVIMAGGNGTRFWPKSRQNFPKQFLSVTTQKSMISETLERIRGIVKPEHIYAVINAKHVAAITKAQTVLRNKNIIIEPTGRNTAACLGLAALFVRKADKRGDGVVIALPADHLITKQKKFHTVINKAIKTARTDDCIVTLGIKPTYPETGYGYIQIKQTHKTDNKNTIFDVQRFTEKPSLPVAKRYCRSENFFWNSGMFVFKHETLLTAMRQHMPRLYDALCVLEPHIGTRNQQCAIADTYAKIDSISIDYGILEKYYKVKMSIADIGWNDIGSWRVLSDVLKTDTQRNVSQGNVILCDSRNNVITTNKQMVACLGMDDAVIVVTDDAVLVTKKERSQDIGMILTELKKQGMEHYL